MLVASKKPLKEELSYNGDYNQNHIEQCSLEITLIKTIIIISTITIITCNSLQGKLSTIGNSFSPAEAPTRAPHNLVGDDHHVIMMIIMVMIIILISITKVTQPGAGPCPLQ